MGLLDNLREQLAVTEAFQGDVISTGQQIRITRNMTTITPVGGDQTFFKAPDKLGFLRGQLRDQGGMLVFSMSISMLGEQIGVLGPDGTQELLPAYKSMGFANWWSWVHIVNTEFMNPNMDQIEEIRQVLEGSQNYRVYRRDQQGERARTAEILWDFEPKGDNLQMRHAHALELDHFTILPDERKAPMLTEYVDRNTGQTVERPGFTSFVDVVMHNTENVMKSLTLPPDTPNLLDIQKQARSRLSLLTGTDERTDDGWSLRPTIGYFSLVPPTKHQGESDETYADRLKGLPRLIAGGEANLFPPREGDQAQQISGTETYENANPFAVGEDQPEL